jgi:hypothetical protein
VEGVGFFLVGAGTDEGRIERVGLGGVVGWGVGAVGGVLRSSLWGGLFGYGWEAWFFFLVGHGGEEDWFSRRGGFEASLCCVPLLLLLLVVLRVVGRVSGRHLVMDSSHGISLGHDTTPMSGGVETAGNDAGDD